MDRKVGESEVCVCVCVCVCACMCACVHAYVHVCGCACVEMKQCANPPIFTPCTCHNKQIFLWKK